jgi:hypothetical protein
MSYRQRILVKMSTVLSCSIKVEASGHQVDMSLFLACRALEGTISMPAVFGMSSVEPTPRVAELQRERNGYSIS